MNPGPLSFVCKPRKEDIGQRLDKVLASQYPEHSRSRLQAWIEQGCVLKNGNVADDCHYKVKEGEEYLIIPPPVIEAIPQPQSITLDIVFEDDDLLVINKPAGLVVHPAPGHPNETLVNALLAHCKDSLSGIGGVKRPGIVHRLDKDTSGLMVVAKNDWTHQHLSKQFEPKILTDDKERSLKRIYWGLVWGRPSFKAGIIEGYLHRHPKNRQKMAVSVEGKGRFARTHYQVKATKNFAEKDKINVSWVTYSLDTGRTHQVRVHSQFAGFPLIGDPLYGLRINNTYRKNVPLVFIEFKRQALHAAELSFIHPRSKALMNFSVSPPFDFHQILEKIF
jgi:23S rRNA pseudouridine1911/1915/1917 synthase